MNATNDISKSKSAASTAPDAQPQPRLATKRGERDLTRHDVGDGTEHKPAPLDTSADAALSDEQKAKIAAMAPDAESNWDDDHRRARPLDEELDPCFVSPHDLLEPAPGVPDDTVLSTAELMERIKVRSGEQSGPKEKPRKLLPAPRKAQEHKPGMDWKDIAISFLSDERVEICAGANNRQTYNYGELGFEDRRSEKPNEAWETLRNMAATNGMLPRPEPGKDKVIVQKRIQEIRKRLRQHFGIASDPIPFNGSNYLASFKIKCKQSFNA